MCDASVFFVRFLDETDAGHRVPLPRQDPVGFELQVREVAEDDLRRGRGDVRRRQPRQAALHEALCLRRHQLLHHRGFLFFVAFYFRVLISLFFFSLFFVML